MGIDYREVIRQLQAELDEMDQRRAAILAMVTLVARKILASAKY